MEQISNIISNITSVQIIDILIALLIIVIFRVLSSTISYAIIRMFKFKAKSAKEIKESAFFKPLKLFFIILGIYLAILFLKVPLNISQPTMQMVTTIFEIISVIAFAIALAKSFTIQSSLIKKMKKTSKRELDDATIEFILKIVRVLIYIIAIFVVLSLLKIDLTGLIAGLGIGGVIVTLAAQDTAKNLFGGVVIFLDKPFNVGDWVQMDAYEGTIEDITFRTTRIRTFENSLLNVPNSIISNASVINWSKMQTRRYKANLRIDFNTSIEKLERVKARIEEMLKERESIVDDATIIRYDNINENGINMLIYTYTDSINYASYLSEVEKINFKIMRIMEEEKVKLAYDTKNISIEK